MSNDEATPRTFSQEELNGFLAEERRKQSARFADYDELKAKAEQHDAAQESAKTELQKAIDRATQAEKERDELKAADKGRQDREAHLAQVKAWVADAAKKTGVPEEAIRGNSEEEINAHADSLKTLVKRRGYAPSEGETPNRGDSSELREFTRQLFHKN